MTRVLLNGDCDELFNYKIKKKKSIMITVKDLYLSRSAAFKNFKRFHYLYLASA